MRNKRYLLFIHLLFTIWWVAGSGAVMAQTSDNDFGVSANLAIEKKLNRRTSIGVEGEFRTQDNSRKTERVVAGVSLDHKFYSSKHFEVKGALGYEYHWTQTMPEFENTYKDVYEEKERHIVYEDLPNIYGDFEPKGFNQGYNKGYNKGYNQTDSYWRQRSRTNASLAFVWKPNKRFSLSLKETLQYTHYRTVSYVRTEYREKYREKYRLKERVLSSDFDYRTDDLEEWVIPTNEDTWESIPNEPPTTTQTTTENTKTKRCYDRFMLRSKLTVQYDIRKSPFAPFASADFGVGLGYDAMKWKLTAGTDIKITKQHSFEVFYRFQKENDDDEPNGHLLGLGYKFKF